MNFITALNVVKEKYKVNKVNNTTYNIWVNNTYDGINLYHVSLKEIDGKPYLTDYGTTFELLEISEKLVEFICFKNNVEFNEYYLEKEFKNIEDVNIFVNCITAIIDANNKK